MKPMPRGGSHKPKDKDKIDLECLIEWAKWRKTRHCNEEDEELIRLINSVCSLVGTLKAKLTSAEKPAPYQCPKCHGKES